MTDGKQLIGFEQSAEGMETFYSINPATGEKGGLFHKATQAEAERAAIKAAAAFQEYRKSQELKKLHF